MPGADRDSPRHPIRVVARRTGLTPELIRAWERRYRAIEPERTEGGHRLYSDDDVARLILLRRAAASGRKIGEVAGMTDGALGRLLLEDELAEASLAEAVPPASKARPVTRAPDPRASAPRASDGGALGPWRMRISVAARRRLDLPDDLFEDDGSLRSHDLGAVREVAHRLAARRRQAGEPRSDISTGRLNALSLVQELLGRLIDRYRQDVRPGVLMLALSWLEGRFGRERLDRVFDGFLAAFVPARSGGAEDRTSTLGREHFLACLILLRTANENPAFGPFRELIDDRDLDAETGYRELIDGLREFFKAQPAVPLGGARGDNTFGPDDLDLFDLLRMPSRRAPASANRQLELLARLEEHLSGGFLARVRMGLDVIREEEQPPYPPPPEDEGAPAALTFDRHTGEARFSPDTSWMPELVLISKNVLVWLDQLGKRYRRPIRLLSDIPDEELRRLASWGVNGLWMVGLWERSKASQRIKRDGGGRAPVPLRANPDAAASAYSLHEYRIATDLGGEDALADLRRRAEAHGVRLACDMVPNHMGIDSRWVIEHPDRFLWLPEPPFPNYTFTGPDLSSDPRVGIFLEDGYADQSDAAVVFKRVDRETGEERYIYHGNDGTRLPWNDTAQIDFLNPEAREAVIGEIVRLAGRFPIVRFDAAMVLARQHVQRLWHPAPGMGGAVPSRAEHGLSPEAFDAAMPAEFWREVVDRLAVEAPDTLLLAEAFWLLETYFVRSLGIHRVYNSAFMKQLGEEKNRDLRESLANALRFDPEVLRRFANYLTTPDETPAVRQLGKGDKYFALTTLMATLPGLPLFGHGQFEGLVEQYGMEYRRAYYAESEDAEFVARHEREIVPLLHHRRFFAGTERFRLFDFVDDHGDVVEDVIAFSNRDRTSAGDGSGDAVVVLVNNSQRPARGRIRSAVPLADGGETEDLALVLGLPAAEHLRFREFDVDGELWQTDVSAQGLEAELGPYDYRVLVDFEAVGDLPADATGSFAVRPRHRARHERCQPSPFRLRSTPSRRAAGDGEPGEAAPGPGGPRPGAERVGIPCLPVAGIELPPELAGLERLAYNFWWTWTPAARELFRQIDPHAWQLHGNPVRQLIDVEPRQWSRLLGRSGFRTAYREVLGAFDRYLSETGESWYPRRFPDRANDVIAYFSLEYGVDPSLAIYSGGLGVLAGDHCKSAGDLGLPLVALGLLYRSGYFRQTIDPDGYQQHFYPRYDFRFLALRPVAGPTQGELVVEVPVAGRQVHARVWLAQVGRIPLLLLDTDLRLNDRIDRPITNTLYVRGREMRLLQELLLGIGGVRALRALGIAPASWHLNEGHCALVQLERIREEIQAGAPDFESARRRASRRTAFTTHTPVPAGNETFDRELARPYLEGLGAPLAGDADLLLALGRVPSSPLAVTGQDSGSPSPGRRVGGEGRGVEGVPDFNLTAFGLRTSRRANAVSRLNAEVTSAMWERIEADRSEGEALIEPITNGVHVPTWIGPEMRRLFEEVVGPRWVDRLLDTEAWEGFLEVDDAELWAARSSQRERLASFAHRRWQDQFARHGRSPRELRELGLLRPDVLRIGFARRFATYKRAQLIFQDLAKLTEILRHLERPVQIVFAGKAHPADRDGQALIREIFRLSQSPDLHGSVFFLEDYDLRVGAKMVQGVDVWLNTPRRPLEASGTSGQKAAMNGVLHLSVLDGWWPEAYDGENGWAFGTAGEGLDEDEQDAADAASLYQVLSEEVVPLFYDRDGDGLPVRWLERVKRSIATVTPRFSASRMVRDYAEGRYVR